VDWPYLTDTPPVPIAYKRRWEDFVVEEIPAYAPSGEGDHILFEIEKRGLATPRALGDIARALAVRPGDIGAAGMKDARAVTRQWLSIEHVPLERVLALEIPRIRVLQAAPHGRKLRRGHLAGNRFTIRLRPPAATPGHGPADPSAPNAPTAPTGRPPRAARRTGSDAWSDAVLSVIRTVLAVLQQRGVPNYYGEQRFGSRGDTGAVGRALARGDAAEAVALIAGRPADCDTGDVRRARELFDARRYDDAAAAWPSGFRQCERLCRALARRGDPARALPAVGKRMLRFYAGAYQSWLFNHVLARRIDGIDRLLPGDLAWKHDSEALFAVDDPDVEQVRADRFEVSPTGPLVGRRMRAPQGVAADLERRVLADVGLDRAELESPAMRPLGGSRRPLRFRLQELAVGSGDDDGAFVELRFALPPGAYATEVLREIAKDALKVSRSAAPGS
jgi:tRNA pseudouridine13 synthase